MTAYQMEVRNATVRVLEEARKVFFDCNIPTPTVSFSNRMTTCAGLYKFRPYGHLTHEIVFSNPIIENNDVQEFCNDTVIHEIAHFVEKVVFNHTGHNERFYSIMRKLGHKNPTRCHTFKVVRRKASHPYQCQGCGVVVELGAVRHSKIQNSVKRYYHSACGHSGILKYIG